MVAALAKEAGAAFSQIILVVSQECAAFPGLDKVGKDLDLFLCLELCWGGRGQGTRCPAVTGGC